ncbi:MAG TPA: hypothetical protein VK048_02355 [Atopostipes sp.]|nr:hypothetical protein [Atopostipes sp.]
MEEWIRKTFKVKHYEIDDLEVFVFNEGDTEGHINVFLELFGHLEPTYESLFNYAKQIGSRWTKYFDDWKEQGILN